MNTISLIYLLFTNPIVSQSTCFVYLTQTLGNQSMQINMTVHVFVNESADFICIAITTEDWLHVQMSKTNLIN